MSNKLETSIKRILFIILVLLPRQYGLTAASVNVRKCRVFKSNLWRIYSIVCACTFSVMYPFAIFAIQANFKPIFEGKMIVFIDTFNYLTMYVFCVAVYLRVISAPSKFIKFDNMSFTVFYKCKTLCKDKRDIVFFALFTTRVLYLYLGHFVLNTVELTEHSSELTTVPFIYKFFYLVPDIVMASEMIRFRSGIFMGITCCQRINQAFVECFEMLKASNNQPAKERSRIYFRAKYTFDKITDCHSNMFSLVKETESLSGILIILSVLKIFTHLSTTVNLV